MFYATVKVFWFLSLTSCLPSEPDTAGSALRWDLWDCAELGGSVTRTGHWVKMGCCLPGPSNPAVAG